MKISNISKECYVFTSVAQVHKLSHCGAEEHSLRGLIKGFIIGNFFIERILNFLRWGKRIFL
jgi:hypothetical protein